MRKTREAYPASFRQQIVELVQAGRKPVELAAEFGCHVTTIRAWVRSSCGPDKKHGTSANMSSTAALNAAERQELLELRRRLKQVETERDILAKATAWFSNNSVTMPKASTH